MEKKRRRRGILIFPLPEDENDFEIAVNAMDWVGYGQMVTGETEIWA